MGEGYKTVSGVIAIFSAGITFIGAYIYCVATYGFLFGLGLGWLPSGILALLVGIAAFFVWPVVALLVIVGIYLLLR